MVDYKYKDLYWKSHIDKQLKITTDDGSVTFTNKDINWEDFELTESLCCEQQLKFGLCEASALKFKISNSFIPLTEKWLTVTETLNKNTDVPFWYGRYKVFSDVPTADKKYRDITAYDAMYDILETDMTQWYNNILPNENTKLSLKQFRTNFISYFHLQQQDITLINDNMIIERTLEPEQISGKDVITAICEINGCFGHIGRDGKFHYIYLSQGIQGLYPSNTLYPDHAPNWLIQSETGHLYPQDPKSTKLGNGVYINCKYEDFLCKKIDKIQIKQQENDIGYIYGQGDNSYIIVDNFLVYGKGSEELQEISKNIFDKITNIIYRPFSAECVGNPCLEIGDPIRLSTKYELIESYILKRTLKGIQGLRDIYEALGQEYRTENVNSVQQSIIQLKGKSNTFTRTIEETKSEIKAFETNVNENYSTTVQMNSAISQSAEGIKVTVSKQIEETKEYANGKVGELEKTLSSKIEQTAENITSTVAAATSKYDTGNIEIDYYGYGEPYENEKLNNVAYASSYLDQSNGKYYEYSIDGWSYFLTFDLITTELNSKIEQNAGEIVMKVDSDGRMVNVKLGVDANDPSATIFSVKSANIELSAEDIISLMSGGTINLSAGKGITIDSPNFKVDTKGNVQANNATLKSATIEGEITAKSGKIGNFTVDGKDGWMEYDKGGNKICGMGAQAAFYAGSGTSLSAPFHVTYDGQLYATGVNISGNVSGNLSGYMSGTVNMSDGSVTGGTIGNTESGWDVTENGLSKGNSKLSSNRLVIVGTGDNNTIINFQAIPSQIVMNPGDNGTISFFGVEFDKKDFEKLRIMIAQSGIVPSSANSKSGGEYE